MRIGLIGCGAIGSVIIKAIAAGEVPGAELVVVADQIKTPAAEDAVKKLGSSFTADAEEVLGQELDLVIEAATQEVVREYAPKILKARMNLMIMSVGALVDKALREQLMTLARENGCRVYFPSGAIGGLDAIKSSNIGELREVAIITVKPPRALEGAPYIEKNKIDLSAIKEPTLIYEGTAQEAAREFPKNINVSVALSLAGIGPERTKVVITADPNETRNVHIIEARGDFGEGKFEVAGLPSPDNPKTSHLAGLSALATLKKITDPFQVGT